MRPGLGNASRVEGRGILRVVGDVVRDQASGNGEADSPGQAISVLDHLGMGGGATRCARRPQAVEGPPDPSRAGRQRGKAAATGRALARVPGPRDHTDSCNRRRKQARRRCGGSKREQLCPPSLLHSLSPARASSPPCLFPVPRLTARAHTHTQSSTLPPTNMATEPLPAQRAPSPLSLPLPFPPTSVSPSPPSPPHLPPAVQGYAPSTPEKDAYQHLFDQGTAHPLPSPCAP